MISFLSIDNKLLNKIFSKGLCIMKNLNGKTIKTFINKHFIVISVFVFILIFALIFRPVTVGILTNDINEHEEALDNSIRSNSYGMQDSMYKIMSLPRFIGEDAAEDAIKNGNLGFTNSGKQKIKDYISKHLDKRIEQSRQSHKEAFIKVTTKEACSSINKKIHNELGKILLKTSLTSAILTIFLALILKFQLRLSNE